MNGLELATSEILAPGQRLVQAYVAYNQLVRQSESGKELSPEDIGYQAIHNYRLTRDRLDTVTPELYASVGKGLLEACFAKMSGESIDDLKLEAEEHLATTVSSILNNRVTIRGLANKQPIAANTRGYIAGEYRYWHDGHVAEARGIIMAGAFTPSSPKRLTIVGEKKLFKPTRFYNTDIIDVRGRPQVEIIVE